MASENIEGTATDTQGNPLQDAVIALFLTNPNATDGDIKNVQYTRTDSNGNYVIQDHPDADGTSQEWHVAGYYQDGTGEFNVLSKPSVEASVGSAIPDSGNLGSDYNANSFSLSDGDAITSDWTDGAGSFDAKPLNTPTYRTNQVNGEPAVEFTGSEYFETGFNQDTNQNRTLYLVCKFDLQNNNGFFYGAQDTAGSGNRTSMGHSGSNYFASYGDGFNSDTAVDGSKYVLFESVANNGTLTWFADGTKLSSISYTGQGTHAYADYIGARNRDGSPDLKVDGKVARILRYETAHGSTTRNDVRDYLNDIYSVF
jgi:hypothetical protein